MKTKHLWPILMAATSIWANDAMASLIEPSTFSATMNVGEGVTIHKTITTDDMGGSTIDLVFGTDFFSIYSTGLTFAFTCTDALGCTDVGSVESRTFDVSITAIAAGIYDFTIGAAGVAARESDHIEVLGPNPVPVPEPATLALLAIGLCALGATRRRRT